MTASANMFSSKNNVVVSFELDDLADYTPLKEIVRRGTAKIIYIAAHDSKKATVSERLMFVDSKGELLDDVSQNYEIGISPGVLDKKINLAIMQTEMQR